MTILETITGLTILIIGLLASVSFYRQVDCYHRLTVEAVELRLLPTEHNEIKTTKLSLPCKGVLRRHHNSITIKSLEIQTQLSFSVQGKL